MLNYLALTIKIDQLRIRDVIFDAFTFTLLKIKNSLDSGSFYEYVLR
jgi:hypothetical protein